MKIGIDYHGVVTANPDFFAQFSSAALNSGHEILIISGGSKKDVEKYLHEHNIAYSDIFSLLDYFNAKGLVTFYPDGSFFVQNELWNKAKAKYCLENDIAVHIDDSMLYGAYFQTPFCLYAPVQQKCTMIKKNVSVNFSQSPQKVFNDIISALKQITPILS